MKRFLHFHNNSFLSILLITIPLVINPPLQAQTNGIDQESGIAYNATGIRFLRWQGKLGEWTVLPTEFRT